MRFLITGASRGIGARLATHYETIGHDVFRASRSTACNVTQPDSVEFFLESVHSLDVVINCAGIASMNHFLLMSPDKARDIMATNFLGTFNVCQQAARLLKGSSCPRIINFSSVAVPLALEGEAVYAASKAAVETFTKIIAKELSPWGIKVNCIGPNPIYTDLIKNVPEDKLEKVIGMQAIKRPGLVDDIINIVDWLIRPESYFVTGQVIYLGGV